MILFAHPTGNQNARHAALALERAGLLGEFWTTLHWRSRHSMEALLPNFLVRELKRRSFPPEIAHRLRTYPWAEIGRLISERVWKERTPGGWFSIDAVYSGIDARV